MAWLFLQHLVGSSKVGPEQLAFSSMGCTQWRIAPAENAWLVKGISGAKSLKNLLLRYLKWWSLVDETLQLVQHPKICSWCRAASPSVSQLISQAVALSYLPLSLITVQKESQIQVPSRHFSLFLFPWKQPFSLQTWEVLWFWQAPSGYHLH